MHLRIPIAIVKVGKDVLSCRFKHSGIYFPEATNEVVEQTFLTPVLKFAKKMNTLGHDE